MSLLRYLGVKSASGGDASGSGETETVRRIADQLDRLEPEQAKYLAAFAYVLARVANADLRIDESETAEMERIAVNLAHLSAGEASLVVEIAKSQTRMLGGTVNKGEHGTRIVRVVVCKSDDDDQAPRSRRTLKHYTVFNVAQCRNLHELELDERAEIEAQVAEQVPSGMLPTDELESQSYADLAGDLR